MTTALAERKYTPELRNITAAHPAVRNLRGRYFKKFGLPWDEPNPSLAWFGVFRDTGSEDCLIVFSMGIRADGGIEGTDFYAQPSRAGVAAAEWVLQMGKLFVDHGIFPYGAVWILGKNKVMQRRIERIFGLDSPRSVMYAYGNMGY